jgi:hypothetical protein
MLDTLHLSLNDFEIRPDANLEVQPGTFNASTGEVTGNFPLWPKGDGYMVGKVAYYNGDICQVTVKAHPSAPTVARCLVEMSVPKAANGSNYEPADFAVTKTALKAVHSELKRIGIKTNLNTATLSRMDACKNVLTSEGYSAYQPVLLSLNNAHLSFSKRDYGSTILWKNTQQQICVYDKIAEMRALKRGVEHLPSNSVRFEHRMLKARKIRDSIGLSSVRDLIGNYDQIKAGYEAAMRKQLFCYSAGEIETITAKSIGEQLQHFRATGSKRWLNDYFVALGIAQMAGSMDALLSAVQMVNADPKTLYRLRKQLNNAENQALLLRDSPHSKRTLKDLYHELERGVLGK